MAETTTPSALPPPPTVGSAPGQHLYGSGTGATSHLPPPPLESIQTNENNKNLPTSLGLNPGTTSPTTIPGGFVRRAAPEPNKRALYIGGLDPRITEDILRQIFETTGHVQNVKIIPDKNFSNKGFNYGFIEYDDPGAAERAMATLNGRRVHQSEIRVNWAYQSNSNNKEDTSNHFHIFVGDLSNEVNDEVLLQAFGTFGAVSEARVMWDMKTGRSRGYGFVAFRDRSEAERALSSMDGEWLGSRAIRCNWANQKGQPSVSQQQAMAQMGMTTANAFGHHHFPTHGVQSYDMIQAQTPQWQTTCYVGNLTPYTSQNDLVPLFQNFGYVVETRFQSDRGFAFVKMDTHENAAMAICQLSGYNVNGRPLKCSWGKDRPPNGQYGDYPPQQNQSQPPYSPNAAFFPQYGGGLGPLSPQAGPHPSAPHYSQGQGGGYGAQQYPPMPAGAGGYGRGNQHSTGQWGQQSANYSNGYGGYHA